MTSNLRPRNGNEGLEWALEDSEVEFLQLEKTILAECRMQDLLHVGVAIVGEVVVVADVVGAVEVGDEVEEGSRLTMYYKLPLPNYHQKLRESGTAPL